MDDNHKTKKQLILELEQLHEKVAQFERTEARRKKADHAQRQLAERIEVGLRVGNIAWWEMELPSGNVIFDSRKAEMLGYLPELFTTYEDFTGLLHPEDYDKAMQAMANHLSGKAEKYKVEYRIKKRDGSYMWLQDTGEVTEKDEETGQTRVIGIVQDITERKQVEDEIQRRNTELAGLHMLGRQVSRSISMNAVISEAVEKMAKVTQSDVAFLFRRDGDNLVLQGVAPPSGSERYSEIPVHKVGECMCGLAVTLGKPLYSQDIYKDMRCTWEECKKAGYQSMAALPLFSGTEIIGVAGLACTEKRVFETQAEFLETIAGQISSAIQNAELHQEVQQYAAELELRVKARTAQLQVANKELEEFSYSVSHDLRAPLRAISGFSSIIARRHRADLNKEGRHYVDNIVQASERMGLLIDDLLTYARLGRTSLRREPVSLTVLLNEISRNMQTRLAEIRGVLEIGEELPVVIGDQTLLSQIFTNLLENAFTYYKPDVPPRVCLTYDNEDTHVVFKVSDNGIGIPLEYQEKIFNMFQRLHSEEEYPGTGIGLATVKKCVELLGGSVWVASTIGQGSTFFIRLPKEADRNE